MVIDSNMTMAKPGKILKWTGISLGAVVLLIVAALSAVTLYLTPERLQSIIHQQADKYLDADVRVVNPRFTVWSSFPHFRLSTDSIIIVSRSLKNIDPNLRRGLPANSDSLATLSSFDGEINIIPALSGKYELHKVVVNHLNLNLVAVNDSLSNFNIIPEGLNSSSSIPYISADIIRIAGPGKLAYFSAATNTHASASLNDISLIRTNRRHNEYELRIPGKISLATDNLRVLDNFPFTFDGNIKLGFSPFSLDLYDYAINLGNTRGKLNLNLAMGNTLQINKLSFHLEPFNVPELLAYFPDLQLARLNRFAANLEVDATARLVGPYKLSSDSLPSIIVDFNIPAGNLALNLDNGKTIPLYHSDFNANLKFNGDNPDLSVLSISPLSVSTPGAELDLSASVADLMTSPKVNAELTSEIDLNPSLKPFLDSSGTHISGKLSSRSKLSFSLPELSVKALSQKLNDVTISSDLCLHNFKARLPEANITLSSDNSSLSLSSALKSLNPADPATSVLNNPLSFSFNSGSLILSAPADSLNLSSTGLALKGSAAISALSNLLSNLSSDIQISAGKLRLSSPEANLSLNALDLSIASSCFTPRKSVGNIYNSVLSPADKRALDNIPHSPEFLTVNTPLPFRNFLNNTAFTANLKVNSGSVLSPAYPVKNSFSGLNLAVSNDSIKLRNVNLKSQKNRIKLSASAGNLRRFLTSSTPVLLPVKVDVALDTVNINKLARAYESGQTLRHGVGATLDNPSPGLDAMDTTAFLIPRNIRADINASIMETVYMNLHLYDLATKVSIADGKADIKDLTISSDFGKARLGLIYDSSDIENIGIATDVSVYDINIVNFFKNFHTLLLMMPQAKNISGILTADVTGSMKIFPDMFANVPSLNASLTIRGRDLTVHQNKFIHHLARMMMIDTYDDIHIRDLDVNASVHDNLIELYPFDFEFPKYKLNMVGTNNFNGKLYYHIGVEKSPAPIPFGINIVGYFHDPELRFGGPTFKIKKGEEVTSSIEESNTFNLVKEVKKYVREFIRKAAESDSSDNSEYAYPVPDYRTARKNMQTKNK